MSYLLDRKKERKRKKFLLGAFFVILLVVLSLLGVFSSFGKFFHFIGRPFWKINNNLENLSETEGHIIKTKKSVFRENISLREKNEELENTMLDYNTLKTENENLKDILGRTQNPNNYTLVRVLSKPNKSPYDTLVIDMGRNESLQNGQYVFYGDSFPLGEIIEVYENSSLVKLYSSPGEITEAEIDVVGANVDLVGRGGGNFEITTPKELVVPNGVALIRPGLSSKVLAIVVDTISEVKDPVNKILLKTPVNIQELSWVQVLKN